MNILTNLRMIKNICCLLLRKETFVYGFSQAGIKFQNIYLTN